MKSKFLKSLLTFGAALLVSASLLIVPAAAEEVKFPAGVAF